MEPLLVFPLARSMSSFRLDLSLLVRGCLCLKVTLCLNGSYKNRISSVSEKLKENSSLL